jgi:hypothetical protein
MSFGSQILANRRFQDYWRKYRPVSTRRWAISKGERHLTREVLRAGFKPRILYSVGQLIPHLRGCGYVEILEAIRLLPTVSRDSLFRQIREVRMMKSVGPLPIVDTLSKSAHWFQRLGAIEERGVDRVDRKKATEILVISQHVHELDQHYEERAIGSTVENIVGLIGDRNQIHFGGLLFVKYLGMPAIKRDLFFRELYTLDEIYEYLTFLPEWLREEILSDLRQKGTARLLTGLNKLLYKHGSI